MPLKQRWIWEIYLLMIILYSIKKAVVLFSPHSPTFLYYFILRSFNPIFYLPYWAHVMNILLGLVHCIPLFLYIHRIRYLNPDWWKYLFILRCIFEIIGHSYEMNTFIAFFYANPKILLLTSVIIIIPQIPSYIVCYRYAFRTGNRKLDA